MARVRVLLAAAVCRTDQEEVAAWVVGEVMEDGTITIIVTGGDNTCRDDCMTVINFNSIHQQSPIITAQVLLVWAVRVF